jgi:hypothetical protein
MSDERDKDETSGAAEPGAAPDRASSSLPRPLQEHLARELRSTYHATEEKPAFLGDPAIPVEFEYQLQRLEAVEKVRHTEKVHNQAIEAVKSALEEIVAGPLDDEFSASGKGQEPDQK